MMKLLVIPNKISDVDKLILESISGIILPIDKLSASVFEKVKEEELEEYIKKIKEKNLEVFLLVNKMIHNEDLEYLERFISKVDNFQANGLMFYDFGVLNVANRYKIKTPLIINQNHLNASIYSHNFFEKKSIFGSVITPEITIEEILEIRNNTGLKLFINIYGHLPISHSRRYVATNYLNHLNKKSDNKIFKIKNLNEELLVFEDSEGTTIFTNEILASYNELKVFDSNNIEYGIMNGFNIPINELINEINKYNRCLNDETIIDDYYKGFFYEKTIYKVKKNEE